jgi:dCMP deaminase
MSLQSYKWDQRFLDMAKLVASWSKDPSTKVGAIISDNNNRIVSIGYNGFPINVNDDERLNDRETKYKIIIHAECNALMFANKSVEGYTLYTYPFMPCPKCAGMIIQSGIKRIVSYNNEPERWKNDFKISHQLFDEAEINLTLYST